MSIKSLDYDSNAETERLSAENLRLQQMLRGQDIRIAELKVTITQLDLEVLRLREG